MGIEILVFFKNIYFQDFVEKKTFIYIFNNLRKRQTKKIRKYIRFDLKILYLLKKKLALINFFKSKIYYFFQLLTKSVVKFEIEYFRNISCLKNNQNLKNIRDKYH